MQRCSPGRVLMRLEISSLELLGRGFGGSRAALSWVRLKMITRKQHAQHAQRQGAERHMSMVFLDKLSLYSELMHTTSVDKSLLISCLRVPCLLIPSCSQTGCSQAVLRTGTYKCACNCAYMRTHRTIHVHNTDPIMCLNVAFLLYTYLLSAIQGSPVYWVISGTCSSSDVDFASSDICSLVCSVEPHEKGAILLAAYSVLAG
jgi:hypothetical protein